MKFKKFFISLILIFLITPSSLLAAIENKAQGITISPPLTEVEIKPGESVTRKIKVLNPLPNQIKVYPSVFDFKAKGETGEPTFMSASQEKRSFSLANWIVLSKTFLVLEPQELEEFEYTIKVPYDGEPGGHYGVIFFGTEPPKVGNENINQVALATMVGSLILAKVPGNVLEKGFLETYSAPYFSFKTPIEFLVRIANVGNVHFKPKGEIKIKNWQGNIIDSVPVNTEGGNVLPDSTRRFISKWNPEKAFGFYKAELKLIYGDSQKEISGVLSFWIIPLWLIILLVVLIIGIIFFIIWRRRQKGNKPQRPHEPKGPSISQQELFFQRKPPKKRIILR